MRSISHGCVAWRYVDDREGDLNSQQDTTATEDHHLCMDPVQQVDGAAGFTPTSTLDPTGTTDVSLDWDNYVSDPSFVDISQIHPAQRSYTFDVDNLDLSSETTGSDVFPLQHDRSPDLPALEELPPLLPRMTQRTSVIMCNSNTCKKSSSHCDGQK